MPEPVEVPDSPCPACGAPNGEPCRPGCESTRLDKKLREDRATFGSSFVKEYADGSRERVDPRDVWPTCIALLIAVVVLALAPPVDARPSHLTTKQAKRALVRYFHHRHFDDRVLWCLPRSRRRVRCKARAYFQGRAGDAEVSFTVDYMWVVVRGRDGRIKVR